ncbi:MAG TPA: asparagine synthase-related protein [Sulfurovum sp.]|uniref:asparagine synthase-related protein n=1 Tax=Sulfurovum sp. TaxID=1969726 RepID=UPI002F952D3A
MSGFFGIYNRNGKPVDKKIVTTMLDAMSYWNPDEHDTWTDGPVALGHTMLWNTPESKFEHLPLQNGAYILTMDARIDNRDELVDKLELPGRPLEEIGDSEFILAAYKKWGEDCPKYLLGDFAFAIWDEKKQQMFCARDHIGIKPFYYYLDDEKFIFSNSLSTVTTHQDILKKLDDTSLALFLTPKGFVDNKSTFFKEVKKVPAASTLVITSENISEAIYWDVKDIRPLYYNSVEQYTEHFRMLFEKAVESRLRTLYPVASHLSGGLDSSSIAVLAARKLKKSSLSLHTFNWAQKPHENADPKHHEWYFSERIAKTEGIKYHRVDLSPSYLSQLYSQVNLLNNDKGFFWEEYLIRDQAHSLNIRTILSGWGGDQLVSYDGYAYYSGLFRKGHFMSAIYAIYEEYHGKSFRILRTIRRTMRELMYPILYKYMDGYYKHRKNAYDPYLYCQDQFEKYAKTVTNKGSKFIPGVHEEQKYLLNEGAIQQRIESWSAAGYDKKVEYTYPLLDKRIIEFSLAIPEELYNKKNGYNRYFFREAISHLIDDDIVWAPKSPDLQASYKRLELYDESLKIWLETYTQQAKNLNSDYIDSEKIITELENYFSQRSENKAHLSSIIESIILLHKTLS